MSPSSAGTMKALESGPLRRQKLLRTALSSLLDHIPGAALPPAGRNGDLQESAFPASLDKE